MRVLHILDHSLPLHSGYAFRTAAILREQRRMGFDTAQLTGPKQGPAVAAEVIDELRYERAPHGIALLGRVPFVNQLDVIRTLRSAIDRLAAEFRPEVIQAHSPCLNGLAAAAVARRRGVPFVYELRASWEDAAVSHGTAKEGGLRYRLSRALETHVLRSADAVVTICEGLRRDVIGRGVAPGRVTVVANAVDLDHFGAAPAADPALKGRFCAPDAPVIGFLGSFYAYEGLDLLLEALPAIRARDPRVHLLLVGGGPEDERLRALARRLGLATAVSFVGRVPQAQTPAYYGLLDMVVFPRRRSRLTELVTPLKPLEAMAQGKLVLASDVGGHRELVVDGETGMLFAPDDPAALAAAVLAALDPGAGGAGIRTRARRYVEAERTWSRVAAGYRGLYEGLLGEAKGRPRAARVGG